MGTGTGKVKMEEGMEKMEGVGQLGRGERLYYCRHLEVVILSLVSASNKVSISRGKTS